MFEDYGALRPHQAAAELLAQREWPRLYDADVLAHNEVPVAATIYFNDPYVVSEFANETAAAVRGLRPWVTDEYEHNALGIDSRSRSRPAAGHGPWPRLTWAEMTRVFNVRTDPADARTGMNAGRLLTLAVVAGGVLGCAAPAPTAQPSPKTITVGQGSLGDIDLDGRACSNRRSDVLRRAGQSGSESAGSCGSVSTPTTPLQWTSVSGGTMPGSSLPVIAEGVARSDIHEVRIVTTSGDSSVSGSTDLIDLFDPLGVDAYAFAIALPPGTQVTDFVALDDNGKELAHQPVATP